MDAKAKSEKQLKHNQDIEKRLKDLIREVIECGRGINVEDRHGQTALHLAAQYWGKDQSLTVSEVGTLEQAYEQPMTSAGAMAIVRLFLARHVEVDISDRKEWTPLHIAVQFNNLEIATILLDYGADPNATDELSRVPLHFARSPRMAQLLLTNGALVNTGDICNRTPLHTAVRLNRIEVVPILLKYGAAINSTDGSHMTPLLVAKSSRMAELLLENGASTTARDRRGSTPLHAASEKNLHEVMKVLLKFGSDVNATDNSGGTALHRAIESLYAEGTTDTIKILLKSGVNANAENNQGYTAIQRAIKSIKEEEFLVLLEQGVEVFPQSAQHQCINADDFLGEPSAIGRLIDASIKLKAAGLSCTRDNLNTLAYRPRKVYFSIDFGGQVHYGEKKNELILECEAEIEKSKNHLLTEATSLHGFMFTDNAYCAASQGLLDALQMVDYGSYPTYENLFRSKFKRLNLMALATKRFSAFLESGSTNAWSLPEELVVKVLAHLDGADLKKLISCSNSVHERFMPPGLLKRGSKRIAIGSKTEPV